MKIELAQVITQIISFLVMLWILSRYAWKPVMQLLSARQQKIETDFKRIEEEKKHLHHLMQDYSNKLTDLEQAAKLCLEQAKEDGRQQAAKLLDEAQGQARRLQIKAEADIHSQILKARKQLKQQLIEAVISTTEKVLPKQIDCKTDDLFLKDIQQCVEEVI